MNRRAVPLLATLLCISPSLCAQSAPEAPPPVALPVPQSPTSVPTTVAPLPQPTGNVGAAESGIPPGYYLVPISALRPQVVPRWYGWQTLLADGASASALLLAGVAYGANMEELGGFLALSSVGGYVLGAPIVHASKGNWGRAGGSLAVRVGAPILLGGIGAGLENCSDEEFLCGVEGALVGGVVGIGAAIALDATVLARDTIEIQPKFLPVAGVHRNGAWFGVTGAF